MKSVGKKMTVGLTAPIMGIGAASIAAFKELDENLDSIATATGATGDQWNHCKVVLKQLLVRYQQICKTYQQVLRGKHSIWIYG